jgi:actin-related protein 2
MDELKSPVILDLGSGFIKTGLADRPIPDFILPNAIGRPVLRSDDSFAKQKLKDIMLSDETEPVRQYLDIALPVQHGIVKNWDDQTLILDYIFKQKLRIDTAEHPMFVTESPMNPLSNREKMMEIFFETFNIPSLQIAQQALLVAYSRGVVTSVVVDSGDGVTNIVPIAENFILSDLVARMNIAGRDITEQLVKLLTLRGYSFHKSADFEIVREIKEKLCFTSANTALDRRIASETTYFVVPYTLPDTRVIKVAGERFEAPEILFKPDLAGKEDVGVSDLLFNTIMKAPIDLRKPFFENIILSGGSTMYPGFSTRLLNDISHLVLTKILDNDQKRLATYKIGVEDPPNRRFLVYQGATVLANLSKGKANQWAFKHEYSEQGSAALAVRWANLGR